MVTVPCVTSSAVVIRRNGMYQLAGIEVATYVERKGCAVTDINATIRRLHAAAKGKMCEAFGELGKKRRSWEKNCAIVSHPPAEDDNVTAFKPFRVAGEGRTLK